MAVRRAKYRAGGEYALKQVNIRTRKRTVNPAALLSPSCRALPGERGVKLGARLAVRDLGKKKRLKPEERPRRLLFYSNLSHRNR